MYRLTDSGLTVKSGPGSEFFAAEKEGSGTALKTRMGSKAVSGSFPGRLFPHEMQQGQELVDFSRGNFYSRLMKKFLTLFLVLALASMASAQNWFKGTLDQAVTKAKSEHKLVLVDFYSYT
jgi:hypothetical protein